jgi:hypothetical protein
MNLLMLVCILISLTLLYSSGLVLFSLLSIKPNENSFVDTFNKLIIGFLLFVVSYSLIKTGGNSISLVTLAVGAIYLIRYYKKGVYTKSFLRSHVQKKYVTAFLVTLVLGVLFFILQGSFFYNSPYNNMPCGDITGYYAKIIDFLNREGIESRTRSLYSTLIENYSPTPYHYPELWFSAIIAKVTGCLPVECYSIGIHSILSAILSLGMAGLSRCVFKSTLLQFGSVLFIFVSGIAVYNISPQSTSYLFANGWNPKLLMVSVFFVWGTISLAQRHSSFYLPLLLLPVANIVVSPAILTSVVLFSIFSILKKKKEYKYYAIIIDTLVIAFSIAVFYILNSSSNTPSDFSLKNIELGLNNDLLKTFKIILGSFAIVFSQYFLYFVPAIILLFTVHKKALINEFAPYRNVFILFSLVFSFGLFYWSISHPLHDSIQFFYMTSILFLNIILLLVFAVLYKYFSSVSRTKFYFFICYFSVLILFNLNNLRHTPSYYFTKLSSVYSESFLTYIKDRLLKDEPENISLVGYISTSDEIIGYWDALSCNSSDNFLQMTAPNFLGINLNVLSTPLDKYNYIEKLRIDESMKKSVFYKYAFSKYRDSIPSSWEEIMHLQYDFITDNHIKYLLLSRQFELPSIYVNKLDTVIVDPVSGEKFVFLK